MTLGIDLSIFLYKYLYNNDNHLEGLTRLILRLLKNQITPVFIFDGKPPKEKEEILIERKERKEYLTAKCSLIEKIIENENILIDEFKNNNLNFISLLEENEFNELFNKNKDELKNEFNKLKKRIIYVNKEHIEKAKILFKMFGVKYIEAPSEAEGLLALLCKNNIIDGCISEDTDVLANGGYLFLRNFNADKNIIEEYCLHGILENLEINYEQFIDMCILCGCDYTTKINGIGPINAYKLIKKHITIEDFINNNKKYIIPENFDYVKARYLFHNPVSKELYDMIDKNVKMMEPNIEELVNFLKNSKLKEKTLIEINNNLINYYLNIKGSE
jgi:flap endonuclease-1